MNKTCTKHRIVLELFNFHLQDILFPIEEVRPGFFKLGKVASSIILPAKTEPIWTLSEPVIKTLCLQMGGCPPPQPPLSFQAVQACCQAHRTMNKTSIKHKTVLELFISHHKGILFAKRGASLFILYYVIVCHIILY